MQLTLSDAEGLGKRKRTRREIFLAERDQVVPWKALLALIEPHYPKRARPGRPPYPLATMRHVHFLRQWYAVSDPDETTMLNCRRLLETQGLAQQILERVNAHLARKGQRRRAGTIVDATIIAAPSSTKHQDGERERAMHQIRKGNQWHFGMKVHIGVDDASRAWCPTSNARRRTRPT